MRVASLILRGSQYCCPGRAGSVDEHVVGAIEADTQTGIERGVLRPVDPRVVARFIVGGIEKIVLGALDEGRTPDIGRIAREIAVLLTCGLMEGAQHQHAPNVEDRQPDEGTRGR
jgi:hypothetical protein